MIPKTVTEKAKPLRTNCLEVTDSYNLADSTCKYPDLEVISILRPVKIDHTVSRVASEVESQAPVDDLNPHVGDVLGDFGGATLWCFWGSGTS